MASGERFSQYTAVLNNALSLTQMDRFSVRPDTQKSTITPGGSIDPAHHGISSASPRITFATRDLTTLFGSLSVSAGLACSATSTFIFQERTDGSTFETAITATHETLTVAKGFAMPTSITASQDDQDGAICECDMVCQWNGSADPIVWNTGQAINAITAPAFGSRFFLGPVYHNGAAISGVTSVSVTPGINYEAKAFSGDPYPRLGAIVSRAPQMQFTVAKVDAAAALSSIFGSAISTGLIFYLQKGVASGTRVAAATTSHCKITAAAGDWALDEASVQGNEDGSVTFTALPTTAITLVVNSAIP